MQSMSASTLEVRKALQMVAEKFALDDRRETGVSKTGASAAALVGQQTADSCRVLYGLLNFCAERDKSSLTIFRTLRPAIR